MKFTIVSKLFVVLLFFVIKQESNAVAGSTSTVPTGDVFVSLLIENPMTPPRYSPFADKESYSLEITLAILSQQRIFPKPQEHLRTEILNNSSSFQSTNHHIHLLRFCHRKSISHKFSKTDASISLLS